MNAWRTFAASAVAGFVVFVGHAQQAHALPDLVVSQATPKWSGDISLPPGTSVTVTYVVTNIGSSSTGTSTDVGIYLSTNASSLNTFNAWFVNNGLCGSISGNGGTCSGSRSIPYDSLDPVPPGTYYVWVRADDYEDVGESNENNNTRRVTGAQIVIQGEEAETVTAPATPTGPTQRDVGQLGSYSTGGATSTLGHSLEYQFAWGDGSTSTWSTSTSAAYSWANTGTYSVRAHARCATHTNVISSWSEPPIAVSVDDGPPPGQPDLVVSSVTPDWSGDRTLPPGTSQTVTYVVTNVGSSATGTSTDVGIYLSTNASSLDTSNAWFVNNGLCGSISANGGTCSGSRSIPYDSLDPVPPGTYYVWVRGDDYANVDESNENNNTRRVTGAQIVIQGEEDETVTAPATPTGPTRRDVGESGSYSTGGAMSTLGHSLEYQFGWGDGSTSTWSTSTSASYSWANAGTYSVRTHARCATHPNIISSWSEPSIVVTVDSDPVICVTPPTDHDFGLADAGATRETTFTIENCGEGTLTGSASRLVAPFSFVGSTSYSLAAGQTQTITVRFAPTNDGTYSDTIEFSGGGGASRAVLGSADDGNSDVSTVTGTLASGDPPSNSRPGRPPANYWVLTITSSGTTRIGLTSAQFDTYLFLYDADGNLLASNDDVGGGTDSRIETFLSAGTYEVEVTAFGTSGRGPYTLSTTRGGLQARSGTPGCPLPTISNTTIFTGLERFTRNPSGVSYTILVPEETNDSTLGQNWWRNSFLFGAWDQVSNQVTYYHYAFLEALVQPQINAELQDVLSERLAAEVRSAEQAVSRGSQLAELLSNLSDPAAQSFRVDPQTIQTTLNNWQSVTARDNFARALGDVGAALSLINAVLGIRGDMLHDIFLHAIANADVFERIDILDEFVPSTYGYGSPQNVGYLLAKEDALRFAQEEFNAYESALNSVISNGAPNVVYLANVTPHLLAYWRVVSPGLGAAVGRVILPYSIALDLGFEVYTDLEAMRMLCAVATVNADLSDELSRAEAGFNVERGCDGLQDVLYTAGMRYALGYAYHNKWDEILDPTTPLDWLGWVVQVITGRRGGIDEYVVRITGYKQSLVGYAAEAQRAVVLLHQAAGEQGGGDGPDENREENDHVDDVSVVPEVSDLSSSGPDNNGNEIDRIDDVPVHSGVPGPSSSSGVPCGIGVVRMLPLTLLALYVMRLDCIRARRKRPREKRRPDAERRALEPT